MLCSEIFGCLSDDSMCGNETYRRSKRLIDPSGKSHKIHFSQGSFCGHAWVWTGPFRRENQYAASDNAICNIVRRLTDEGWKIDFSEMVE